MFRDRREAGRQLAQAFACYRHQPVVVYALPRGSVVPAFEIARFLKAPMDLLVVRKIGHPASPEYAIGAVAEDGYLVTNPNETSSLDQDWLRDAATAEWREAQRRRKLFLGERDPLPAAGKTAIIVDDGLATGLTMQAAIHEVQNRHPRKVVVAVPVGAAETVAAIRSEVDDLVVLHVPHGIFGAIGSYYRNFEQLRDEEVVALMESVEALRTPHNMSTSPHQ
jgi:putative phosphoribosyl transferase